jgi:O-antigen ligase
MLKRRSGTPASVGPYASLLVGIVLTVLAAAVADSLGDLVVQKVTLYGFALLAGLLVARIPQSFLVFVLVVEQYAAQSTFGQLAPWFNRVGSGVYYLTKNGIPVLVGIAFFAAAGSLYRLLQRNQSLAVNWREIVRKSAIPAVLFAIISIYMTVYTLTNPNLAALSMVAGLVGVVTPWVLMANAYIVTLELVTRPGGQRQLGHIIAVVVATKGILALLTWSTTGGAVVDGQAGVVFYGPVTPLLGIAIVGAWASGLTFNTWPRRILLAAATVCIVGSFRLTIFIAAAAALVLSPIGTRVWAGWKRGALFASLFVVCVFFLYPFSASASKAVDRIAALGSLSGETGIDRSSAVLHLDDVKLGLDIALLHPVFGVGPNAPQPPEFADSLSTTLYVHNEYLQQWLKFGLVGLCATVTLFVLLCRRGWSVLRQRPPGLLLTGAAVLLSLAWLPVLTAPFFSSTQGFPVLLGLATALCDVQTQRVSPNGSRGQPFYGEADPIGPPHLVEGDRQKSDSAQVAEPHRLPSEDSP